MSLQHSESGPAAAARGPAEPFVQVIRHPGEWEAIEPQWDALFAASPTAAPPLRFDWLREWWRIYGPTYGGMDGLRILIVQRDGRLIGALPLYQCRNGFPLGVRRLCLLAQGEEEFEEICPDYMDLLHLPEERDACVSAIRQCLLAGELSDWDLLELADLPIRSPLLHAEWEGCRAVVASRGVCPAADISGGLEAFFQRQSANSRQQNRRLLRGAEKAGVTLTFASTPEQIKRYFDDMIDLHQQRWMSVGKPGVFSATRFTRFHRALAEKWVPDGRAVLARLAVEDRPLAVIYGFTIDNKFHFYQSGVAIESDNVKSPGIVAFLLLMAELAQRGIEEFDFLRGSSEYKQRLATHEHAVMKLTVVRPTVRSYVHFAGNFLGRAARKGFRLIRPKRPAAATAGA